MKDLHVVHIVWGKSKASNQTTGYLVSETKKHLLVSHTYDELFKIFPVVSEIPKSQVKDLKTICLIKMKK